jgi:hypothetical protein
MPPGAGLPPIPDWPRPAPGPELLLWLNAETSELTPLLSKFTSMAVRMVNVSPL